MHKLQRAGASLLGASFLFVSLVPVLFVRPLNASRAPSDAARVKAVENIREARIPLDTLSALPLQAGWAKRDISPKDPLPLAGFGVRRGALSEGVSSPLFCKALALRTGTRTVVLVSLDLLLVPETFGREVRRLFSARTGLPPNALFLAPIHTHAAPDPWKNPVVSFVTGGGYSPAYGIRLRKAVLEAATEAVAELEPAELSFGRNWMPDYVRNRVRSTPVDAWLEWMAVRKIGRDTFCLVANYSAHGTVLNSSHRKADADYPGQFTAALEAKGPVEMALFQAGALGSASPRVPAFAQSKSGSARIQALGEALAEEVSAVHGDLDWQPNVALGSALVSLPLPPFQFRLGMTDWILAPWFSRTLGFGNKALLHIVQIENNVLIGMPVEFNAEISLDIKEQLQRENDRGLWIVSMSTGFYGYLSPDELYGQRDKKGRPLYEASTMAFLGPHAEYYFRSVVHHAATLRSR